MSKAIFITGTNTDVGKTYVSALILKKLIKEGKKGIYYKAALSGAYEKNNELIPGDGEFVLNFANLKNKPSSLVSYIYKTPVSPHLAAKIEGNPVKLEKVKEDYENLKKDYDYIIVEGSGGIVCPIVYDFNSSNNIFLEDIIKHLNLETIIVADAGLGTINSTVLTYEYLKNHGINVAGIILNNFQENNFMHKDNLKVIEDMLPINVIATVSKNDENLNINVNELINCFK